MDNTIGTAIFDEYGTASVDVVLPAGTPGGRRTLTVTRRHDRHRDPGDGPDRAKPTTTVTAEADA